MLKWKLLIILSLLFALSAESQIKSQSWKLLIDGEDPITMQQTSTRMDEGNAYTLAIQSQSLSSPTHEIILEFTSLHSELLKTFVSGTYYFDPTEQLLKGYIVKLYYKKESNGSATQNWSVNAVDLKDFVRIDFFGPDRIKGTFNAVVTQNSPHFGAKKKISGAFNVFFESGTLGRD